MSSSAFLINNSHGTVITNGMDPTVCVFTLLKVLSCYLMNNISDTHPALSLYVRLAGHGGAEPWKQPDPPRRALLAQQHQKEPFTSYECTCAEERTGGGVILLLFYSQNYYF